MKQFQYPVQIWFLYDDLYETVKSLNDKILKRSIWNIINILLAVRFYYIGIRGQKFYNYYFKKENKQETIEKYFTLWPFKKLPSFKSYNNKVSKWARLGQHYQFLIFYLKYIDAEYQFRFGKDSGIQMFLTWEKYDAPDFGLIYAKNNIKIQFPWKVLNPKYRNSNICLGYRNQYKALLKNYGIKIDDFSKRDIPEFLLT